MSLIIHASAKPSLTPIKIAKKTTSSSNIRPPKLTPVERPNDFLSVAERVNGRAAMICFTSAVID